MLLAAVDTATLTLSCSLCDVAEGRVRSLCDRTDRAPPRPTGDRPTTGHGDRLPEALTLLLLSVGKRIADVEAYAVGLGPGSFTGLRVGLATWKGLAYANRRPIAGASSLAAMALAAAPDAPDGALLLPLLDARKGEVYAGFYRAQGEGVEPLAPEAALTPQGLLERLVALRGAGAMPLAFGEGYEAHAAAFSGKLVRLGTGVATPPADAVARLAAPRLAGAPFDPTALYALEPHYVRPSEAEVKFPQGIGGPGGKRGP